MTLLQQIQEAALDQKHLLADLLRKCLVLSYRLDHMDFREWVERELKGYPDDVDLPSYRHATGDLRANVSGMFGAFMNDVPVPMSQIPEDHRESLRNFDFRQSVGELEKLAAGAESGTGRFMRSVPMELCAKVVIYERTSTVRMWSEISASKLIGVLDQIRTRALQFALEVEKVNASAGEAMHDAKPAIPAHTVNHIFNTVITGGMVNVGASPNIQQVAITVQTGDLESLVRYLRAQGVGDEEVEALKGILPAESESSDKAPGPKTQAWIKRVGGRIAASGGRVAESTLTSVLTSAVKSFMGLQ